MLYEDVAVNMDRPARFRLAAAVSAMVLSDDHAFVTVCCFYLGVELS